MTPTPGATPQQSHAATASRRARLRIGSVRIDDFRALRGLCLRLDPATTVLLGENNTGKSSVLEALGVALGPTNAVEEDLHLTPSGQRASEFRVHLTLEPEQGGTFEEFTTAVLGDAVFRGRDGRELVALRAVGAPAGDGSGVTVRRHFVRGWEGCADTLDGVEELRSPGVSRPVLDLVSFTLLDAKRDLVADLRQRRTAWGRLLARLEIPQDLATEIAGSLRELGDSVIDASAVLTDLRMRLQKVGEAMGSSVSDVELAPVPSRVEELARAIDVLVSAPGGAQIPLRLQGMGSRSLAALMVFQAFVEMRLGADLGLQPLAVTALEEPEAHLHPQAQAAVGTLISALPGQKIVSTHAARVATTVNLDQIRFLRRGSAGIDVRSTSRRHDTHAEHKVRRLVLRPLGDVLFARLVVLGDGATEADALPVFARAHWGGRDPEGRGVAFPELESLGGNVAQALVPALEDLGIPWLALVDGDEQGQQAVTAWEARLGRSLDSAPEIVRLADGHGFERCLVAAGHADRIASGLKNAYGPEVLTSHATSIGRAEEDPKVLLAALKACKGTYGRPVAEALTAEPDADGRPCMPGEVRQLFQRADTVLGGAP